MSAEDLLRQVSDVNRPVIEINTSANVIKSNPLQNKM